MYIHTYIYIYTYPPFSDRSMYPRRLYQVWNVMGPSGSFGRGSHPDRLSCVVAVFDDCITIAL